MSDASTEKARVQNFLRGVVAGARFFPVKYTESGGANTLSANPVLPDSVEANEVSVEWVIDERYGRGLRYRPVDWVFELILKFDREVDFGQFKSVLESGLKIPADPGLNLRQILLRPRDSDILHPPRQASGGTSATFSFDASIGRA